MDQSAVSVVTEEEAEEHFINSSKNTLVLCYIDILHVKLKTIKSGHAEHTTPGSHDPQSCL